MQKIALNNPAPAILGPNPNRLPADALPCALTPVLTFDGVAQDVTSSSVKRKFRGVEYVRVGTAELNLSHEFEPGWPIALRLQTGSRYSVEVFECLAAVRTYRDLPRDLRTADGIIFFNIGKELNRHRDLADRRRTLRDCRGVWTDGLAVVCSSTNPDESLKVGQVYKVVVTLQKSSH